MRLVRAVHRRVSVGRDRRRLTMAATPYRYLYGPVISRRLGRSLGIDLVPAKTCSFNCPFCQLGPTRITTLARRAYVPVSAVLAEFSDWVSTDGRADIITFAGSGEPTLHSGLGRILAGVKARSPARTALFTNGSLFHLAAVRRDACRADIVKASLSAWDQASFQRINRPDPALRFERLVRGLERFRGEFSGQLWIEVFVIPGINSGREAAGRLKAVIHRLNPDRIQLNTAVRPPAEAGVRAARQDVLGAMQAVLGPRCEVIAARNPGPRRRTLAGTGTLDDRIIALVRRHPCTQEDVAAGLGEELRRVSMRLRRLVLEKRLNRTMAGGRSHYLPPVT